MYGQEIQKGQEGEEGPADLHSPDLAQNVHQTDQATLWFEQIPNALDHFWQRSGDRIRPGVSGSPLNGLHSEACRKARRSTDAEHGRVSSGSQGKRDGCLREAQEEQGLVLVPCLETLSRASEQIRGIPFNWQGSRAYTEPDPGDLLFPPGFFIA